jgi:hypothetical protein
MVFGYGYPLVNGGPQANVPHPPCCFSAVIGAAQEHSLLQQEILMRFFPEFFKFSTIMQYFCNQKSISPSIN